MWVGTHISTVTSAQLSQDPIAAEIAQANTNPLLQQADASKQQPAVSPVRRIDRSLTSQASLNAQPTPPGGQPPRPPSNGAIRTYDGSHNNLDDPLMGAAGQNLLRLVSAAYADGVSSLAGYNRPSARAISNAISTQTESMPNEHQASDFVWQWGQFIDHDFTLSDGADPAEPANIQVPAGDLYFDPGASGTVTMAFNRSIHAGSSGTGTGNPRQQINEITAWIDASNVYGSDEQRALALRTLDGTGRLKTSEGNLLPFNEAGLPNAGGNSAELFLAGDVRANEQVGLTAMHVLFVREHNWQANRIRQQQPSWTGEQVYQAARRMVAAEMQAITYHEYLPALLGKRAIAAYRGYDAGIDGTVANEFSHAMFRYGHSALSPTLKRLNAQGDSINAGDLPLRDAFFAPHRLIDEGGIEPLLRGMASQISQKVDNHLIDDVRNFLFGPPGSGGFDLAALNIQRGRDHGLPDYNTVRQAYGLRAVRRFADITGDRAKQEALAAVYDSVNDIDLWVGALCEDPHEDAMVGELIYTALKDQFEALRDGDRFWYENDLSPGHQREINNTRLSDIIRRNSSIGNEIQDDVFHVRR